MGTQSQIIIPQGCKECPFFEIVHSPLGVSFFCRFYKKGTFSPFFEIVHSPLGVSFFCRFYKKGTFSLNGKKFDFCKVEKIEVYESKSNDDLN